MLAAAAGVSAPAGALRADPALVASLLGRAEVHRALFGAGGSADLDPRLFASPYLVFSVLVHRVAAELADEAFVEEWLGPGQVVPVFDVAALRELLADAGRRAFLAELLASYTRVASGSVWQRTPRGWRRRRYSDLDPVQLADLLELVPAAQRPGVCRRLGDLACS